MKILRHALCALLPLLFTAAAHAEPYPSRQIQIITPGAPGGSLDVLLRIISEPLAKSLGQPVLIMNKTGAGGLIAVNEAARARPDGYTLLFTQAGAVTISPAMNQLQALSILRKLQPVTQVSTLSVLLTANASVPAKNLRELVQLAKERTQRLSYATAGNQYSLTYLYSLLFSDRAGIKLLFVPYKTSTQALTDLASGQINLMFDASTAQYPEIVSGRVRPLAVFGKTRSALLPDVPTAAEQGFDVVQGEGWYGLLAPAGAPAAAVHKINSALLEILERPEIRARIRQLDMHVSALPPDKFKTVIEADARRWSKLIADKHIAEGK
ncbi:Bug family tripartite tricarboxylate transporter substrate binding protein [Candidimonas nitroreducens]|uniref:ABC transporter substrate-binding protein n=1 Tax=Candidimonas nitroreducens TaxID=683354 RepID=A0A225M493_9BURK|nr:tripartite tricarboxylate transporter substrate binding protein [Candidimonas nitroreducens]OWT53779.1 hypothetical protein CEY11_23980 [Candidimonas nitroreducens]